MVRERCRNLFFFFCFYRPKKKKRDDPEGVLIWVNAVVVFFIPKTDLKKKKIHGNFHDLFFSRDTCMLIIYSINENRVKLLPK